MLKEIYNVISEWGSKLLAVYMLGYSLSTLPCNSIVNWIAEQKAVFSSYFTSIKALITFVVLSILIEYFRKIEEYWSTSWRAILVIINIFLCLGISLWQEQINSTGYVWSEYISIRFVAPVFLCAAYFFFVQAYYQKIKYETSVNNASENNDDPKKSVDEDKLNHAIISNRISQIITSLPAQKTLRVGIIGEWGSGKTSIMNFIKEECNKKGNCVIWFNPWLHQTKETLWSGFRETLENGIVVHQTGDVAPALWMSVIDLYRKIVRKHAGQYTIGKVLDELIEKAGGTEQDRLKSDVERLIHQYIGNKKVIVFIDDLDRITDTKVIMDLLRGIKELVNLQGIVYIIGFDEDIIGSVLEKELPKGTGKIFLDKIIDYRVRIVNPAAEETAELAKSTIALLKDANLKQNVILGMIDILPENPRELKKFINYLALLQPTLSRFDNEELQWDLVYITQLIGIEYPQFTRDMLKTGKGINLFTGSWKLEYEMKKANNRNSETNVDTEIEQQLLGKLYNAEADKNKRLISLVRYYNDRLSAWDHGIDAYFYFRLIETTDLLTVKEFHEKYNLVAEKSVECIEDKDINEYVLRLGNYRSKQIGIVNSVIEVSEMTNAISLLNEVDTQMTMLLETKIDILKVEPGKILIRGLLSQLNIATQSKNDLANIADKTLTHIKYLLLRSAKYLEEYGNVIDNDRIMLYGGGANHMALAFREIDQQLVVTIRCYIISSFMRENSTKAYMQSSNYFNRILFRNSDFYSLEVLQELANLSEKAKSDKIIRNNLNDYLQALFLIAVQEPQRVVGELTIIEFIKSEVILNIIKKVYTAVPVTAFAKMYFNDYFAKIKTQCNVDIPALTGIFINDIEETRQD